MTVHWVQDDIDGPFRREVDDVVVATIGDRTYEVPAAFDFTGFGVRLDDQGYVGVSGSIRIVEGRARYDQIQVHIDGSLSPKEVQKLPWGQIAESAVAVEAAEGPAARKEHEDQTSTEYDPAELAAAVPRMTFEEADAKLAELRAKADAHAARADGPRAVLKAHGKAKAARAARERRGRPRQYRQDREELYQQVLDLRSEAESKGEPYARFVGDRLGYNPAYVRRLHADAADWEKKKQKKWT